MNHLDRSIYKNPDAHLHKCPTPGCSRTTICSVVSCKDVEAQKCGPCGAEDLGNAVNPMYRDRFDEQQESILFPYLDQEVGE